jgi:zinc protease
MARPITEGVRETTLRNGLRVLTKEARTAPLVTCWAWYRVGSRNERPGITGAAHWVEHMLFKGTEKLKKGEVGRLVSRRGGYWNGFTTEDTTCYFETLPRDFLDLALEIESDRMVNAAFDPAEAEAERTVIIAEREMSENHPQFQLYEEMLGAAYRVHPYGWPVIGHMCDLRAMTRDDLYTYYRTYYAPNNCVLVLVGDFEADAALARVERFFGGIANEVTPPPVRSAEPAQYGERRVVVRRPGGAVHVGMMCHAPKIGEADSYPLAVLDAVFSGAKQVGWSGTYLGRSARLYRALVETGLAASAGSGYRTSRDPGLYIFWATVREGADPDAVEAAIVAEIEKAAAEPPTREELEKAIRQTRAQFAYGADGVSGQAMAIGANDSLASYHLLAEYEAHIAAVTPEDVQRAAQTYLSPDNRTIGRFVPTGPGGAPESEAPLTPHCWSVWAATGARLAAQRFQMDNGAVLLVAENHDSPAAAVKATMEPGAIVDPEGRDGLAAFAANLLTHGTAKRSHQEIAEAVESRGASIAFGAAVRSIWARGKCAGEDVAFILERLEDCWRNSVFPAEEVEKARGQVLTYLKEQLDDTGYMANRLLNEALYPQGHPFRRQVGGDPETVRQITREDLVAFHQAHTRPEPLVISVAGDVQIEAVREAVARTFGAWKAPGARPEFSAACLDRRAGAERSVHPMMHKSQCNIAIGYHGPARASADFYAAGLANLILGRLGLMGRLGENVRDRQGLAYHASSSLEAGMWCGRWVAHAGVNPQFVDRAVESIYAELRRIAAEPVSDQEVADAKQNQVGGLALRLETTDRVVDEIEVMEEYGLGLDFLERYPGIVNAVTQDEILAAAARYLQPERGALAIAGPYPA